MLRFLSQGKWSQQQVHLQQVPGQRMIVPAVERAVEESWAIAKSRPGVNLFDGPMCRLESWEASPDRFTLHISQTSYKIFLGTNMSHPEFASQYGKQVMADPVGVSPALLTCDGQLLLGRRNSTVAYYPERVHPFSGSLEPQEADPFSAVLRELNEELSLASDELTDLVCTGMVEDANLLQPELIFSVRTRRSRAEVEARLDPAEHRSMVAFVATPAVIENEIKNPQLTPVAVGTLLLWGLCNIGQAWFEKMSV